MYVYVPCIVLTVLTYLLWLFNTIRKQLEFRIVRLIHRSELIAVTLSQRGHGPQLVVGL